MAKRRASNSRLVYSTDSGRLCPGCQRPKDQCVCARESQAPEGDGVVRGLN
jgi:translation initiation factor 1